jgi:hypothetical protein
MVNIPTCGLMDISPSLKGDRTIARTTTAVKPSNVASHHDIRRHAQEVDLFSSAEPCPHPTHPVAWLEPPQEGEGVYRRWRRPILGQLRERVAMIRQQVHEIAGLAAAAAETPGPQLEDEDRELGSTEEPLHAVQGFELGPLNIELDES